MIPAKHATILFGLILSGLMSLIVSGLSTARAVGLVDGFVLLWLGNWTVSWAIAFPTVLVVAPLTRRIVARLVRQGP
jgi:membrane protein implicated in regulation of membrane protease activity